MFGSAVLDLAVGLIFCFLTVSLAAGTVVEAISSITKWRAKTLRKGVGELLNDPQLQGLAGELYAHAAINPLGPGVAAPIKNEPAYIDRQLFANALMDLTGISEQVAAASRQAGQPDEVRPTLEALHAAVTAKCRALGNPQLQQFLTGIVERSFGDVDKIRTDLSTWFDHSMDRVSGAYKRWTQAVAFIVALALAVGLNIDTVTVAKVLWTQPKLAEQLKLSPAPQASAPAGGSKPDTAATPDMVQLLEELNTTLPIGWAHGFWYHDKDNLLSPGEFGIALMGWLITALATLFGAPFWFDLLQTVIRLKGAGPSPKEKVEGKGASA